MRRRRSSAWLCYRGALFTIAFVFAFAQPAAFTATNAQESEESAEDGDRDALIALFEATGGQDWVKNQNWLSGKPLSAWYGVTTDENGRVTRLSLRGNQLSGEIPAELGALSDVGTAGDRRQPVERREFRRNWASSAICSGWTSTGTC